MNDVKLVSKMASQVWIALQSWASEGGAERQEVAHIDTSQLEQISTEQRKTCCCSGQEAKRLLPLVRFSLMDTQFFRQDLSSLCFQ